MLTGHTDHWLNARPSSERTGANSNSVPRPGRAATAPKAHYWPPTRPPRSDTGFADTGFAGRLVDWARDLLRTTVEIVRKPADQRGFVVHPRRWVVERTLAWLTAHRRLARDYETHRATSEAMIRWAALGGMLRRLARGEAATRQQRLTFNTPD
uniref:transposase n=1 Tax=Salinispora oceanensis TaxID=1050199 RepID=UPI00039AE0A1|nr:transposase [Salinispora oceanensis]